MKYIQVLLAVVVLTFASGAIQSARAEEGLWEDSVTLYTSMLRGEEFHCNAVNVSDNKTLDIGFTIFDVDGAPLHAQGNPSLPLLTLPRAVAKQDITVSPANNGYCKVEVFGTRNRNDVRVQLNITLTRTFGPNNDIPVFVFRTVEGH